MESYVEHEVIDGVAIFRLIGEFTTVVSSESAKLFDFLENVNSYLTIQRQNDRPIKVIVDMEKCQKIMSIGLGPIISAHLNVKKAGGELEVINLHGFVLNYFKLTRMNYVIKYTVLKNS